MIEGQIKKVIEDAMAIAHEEQKVVLETTIYKAVNGKIDAFREDQRIVNESQNETLKNQDKKLEEISKKVDNVVEFYDGSSRFFKASKMIAMYISAIGAAGMIVWAFIKFVVLNAIK